MRKVLPIMACFCLLLSAGIAQQAPKRELRGAWIATYANIDWPNSTHTPQQQQSTLLTILNHHQATGINTVYLQIRSQCDAMYQSTIEPWSRDLTGLQGRPPSTPWDPMAFAIEEAHKRGMELHGWINPYRAIANVNNLSTFAENHVTKRHPEWLIASGNLRTLDPGLPEVRDYIMTVINDIVDRYDLDGIHFDDYFYPNAVFNDDATYNAHPRGFTDRGDWRRDNVNLLIQRVHANINARKPWVKFGVSPSGIYRNSPDPTIGTPTAGLQHYVSLYADSRKWLQEGWVDYLAPQVYWYMGQPGANYSLIVPWWNNNAFGRHIYIGMAGYKVNDPAQGIHWANPSQIPNQMRLNRDPAHTNIYGQAIYNTGSLRSTTKLGFRDSLRVNFYAKPALQPTMPWRDNTPPAAPSDLIALEQEDGTLQLNWTGPAGADNELDKVRQFVVYRAENGQIDRTDGANILAITTTATTSFTDRDPSRDPDKTYYYTVTALDRLHNESSPSNTTDYAAPTIACLDPQVVKLDATCAATLPDYRSLATVSDDVSAPGEITLTQSLAPGTEVNGVQVLTVTLTATDASGKSASCSFEVSVEDQILPVVATRNITRSLVNGSLTITAADVDNQSSDNCGIASLSLNQTTFDCTHIGENTVLLTVRDQSGNVSTAPALVTVLGVVPQPAISLSRTDNTYTGLPANTLALGYGAQKLTLTASNSTSATGSSTFSWTPVPGLTILDGATAEFAPQQAGVYSLSVLVTNEFGCTSATAITVSVMDVRCGTSGEKVLVYQRTGNSNQPSPQICIATDAVAAHLMTGSTLHPASETGNLTATTRTKESRTLENPTFLTAYPNPFSGQTTLSFTSGEAQGQATLEIFDLNGRLVKQVYAGPLEAGAEHRFQVDLSPYNGRLFLARLVTPGKVHTFKLVKQR